MTTHEGEEHRHQIYGSEQADAQHETEHTANCEAAVRQRPQLHHRRDGHEAPAHEGHAGGKCHRGQSDHQRRGPAALRGLLQRDLQRCEGQGHQNQRYQIQPPDRTGIRALAGQQPHGQKGADDSGRQIYQEQPVPGIGLGDPATDDRTHRRRQHRQHARDRRGDALALLGKKQKNGGEHPGDQGSAGKPLHHPPENQGVEILAERAPQRGQAEETDRAHEQPAHGQGSGKKPGQGNRDDLGDQIGRLDPAHLVWSDADRSLDRRQGRGDDLNVQDGHEHAQAHDDETRPQADGVVRRYGREAGRHRDLRTIEWRRREAHMPRPLRDKVTLDLRWELRHTVVV